MENEMVEKFKVFEPSNEDRAFVYQQTQDLATSNNVGPVSVSLSKNENSGEYVITFMIQTAAVQIFAKSKGENLHEACISAKNEMKKKLFVLTQFSDHSQERDQFIDDLKKNPYIH